MYTISEFAARSGLTLRALRIYDERGLLRARRDPTNGYRCYTDADLPLARRVALLRALGFSLSEVTDLLWAIEDREEARGLAEAFRARRAALADERAALALQERALARLEGLLEASDDPGGALAEVAALPADERSVMMQTIRARSARLSAPGEREHNEDRALTLNSERGDLYVVADGTGPGGRGAEASELICSLLAEQLDFDALTPSRWADHLQALLARADEAVRALGGGDLVATAVAILALRDGVAFIAHVGDCRVYRLSGGALEPLTVDHSVVQVLLDKGKLTPEGVRSHPDARLLTAIVGAPEPALRVGLHREQAPPGARYLLTTDGITHTLTRPEIQGVLEGVAEPQAAVDCLVRGARGGDDNATAVIVDIPPG